jgi:hypothetical protein
MMDKNNISYDSFYYLAKTISKNSKMEKSITSTSFFFILSITTTILLNCIYALQFSNQKSPSRISQTAADTFLTSIPPSSAENSPPPPNIFDWFCCHNFQNRKLYYHIILFSPTSQLNLNFLQITMPHSPKNRARRHRFSTNYDQVNQNPTVHNLSPNITPPSHEPLEHLQLTVTQTTYRYHAEGVRPEAKPSPNDVRARDRWMATC